MSLSSAQRMDVKRHLGYESVGEDLYRVLDAFHGIEASLSTLALEVEADVCGRLEQLAALEEQLAGAPERASARGPGAMTMTTRGTWDAWSHVQSLRRDLSALVGVPGYGGGGPRSHAT